MTAMIKLKIVDFAYLLFVDERMDGDGPNLDIAIVVGNDIRIGTECSGQSNNKVILCLTI